MRMWRWILARILVRRHPPQVLSICAAVDHKTYVSHRGAREKRGTIGMRVRLIPLSASQDEKPISVAGRRFVIGRARDCDLSLSGPLISRHHCQLEFEGDWGGPQLLDSFWAWIRGSVFGLGGPWDPSRVSRGRSGSLSFWVPFDSPV